MELVLHKGRTISEAGDRVSYHAGVRLDLGAKQAMIVRAALQIAAGQISAAIEAEIDSDLDGNDLCLIDDAIKQLQEAEVALSVYYHQR